MIFIPSFDISDRLMCYTGIRIHDTDYLIFFIVKILIDNVITYSKSFTILVISLKLNISLKIKLLQVFTGYFKVSVGTEESRR